jgi:hypothetical protein
MEELTRRRIKVEQIFEGIPRYVNKY